MGKTTDIDLENIPDVLKKIVGVINQEVDRLSSKQNLELDEAKLLISYFQTLTTGYKEYRAEVLAIQKDLRSKSQSEILSMVRSEVE
jgi:hypothetical protein